MIRWLRAMGVALGMVAAPVAASSQGRPESRDALTAEQTAQVDLAVGRYMGETRAPGAAAAVVRGGRVVFVKGYGVSDLEALTPVTPRTIFRLASVSKPITATAVLQLAEQGQLNLDAPVGQYVANLSPALAGLTLRDLLRHTGGVRTYRGEEFFTQRRCEQLADAVAVFAADPLDHAPGERQTYSTYGYTLLGLAVEAAAKRPFFDQLRRSVLRPADMRRTYPDDPRLALRDRARPYVRLAVGGVGPARPVDNTCKVPGGGMLGSLEDVARFAAALQAGELLGPAARAEMVSNQLSPAQVAATLAGQTAAPTWGYGLGLQTGTARRAEAVLHTGGGVGATTILYLLPAQDTAVVVLSNIENAGPQITVLADAIADMVAPAVAPPLA